MQKRHFITLANKLKGMHPSCSPVFDDIGAWHALVDSLADWCQSENPRFNRERWISYINGECGPNGGSR